MINQLIRTGKTKRILILLLKNIMEIKAANKRGHQQTCKRVTTKVHRKTKATHLSLIITSKFLLNQLLLNRNRLRTKKSPQVIAKELHK